VASLSSAKPEYDAAIRRGFGWALRDVVRLESLRDTVDELFTSMDHAVDLTTKRLW
jgi:hypothetical protein